ncbi:hypothetical protein Forpe1208_v001608 [Fusarium oxysporum f. sp. rapae]|uniref:Uncharacterized protein n=1 Tax=Fusarium oxysporum f. sp. rapae TaxID=485398 RepID=A0A8J5PFA3_FUSOX|nr:hypothetical protein Forpe1208_v001608 [Fusarium oxysporum f. sp. rapae]
MKSDLFQSLFEPEVGFNFPKIPNDILPASSFICLILLLLPRSVSACFAVHLVIGPTSIKRPNDPIV